MFTDDEAVALVVGLLAVRRSGLRVAAANVEGALAKLERVLPAALGTPQPGSSRGRDAVAWRSTSLHVRV